MQVKINNKKYDVPTLTFEHFTKIEEQGFSLVEAFKKQQMMLLAMGFTCIVADCDREQAEFLIEQHVYGGGSLVDVIDVFGEAISKSDFFKKMLGVEPEIPEEKPAKKAKKETEVEN